MYCSEMIACNTNREKKKKNNIKKDSRREKEMEGEKVGGIKRVVYESRYPNGDNQSDFV